MRGIFRNSLLLESICCSVMLAAFSFALPQTMCFGQSKQGCTSSTAEETRGPEFSARAQSFLLELQKAVKNNDKTRFAELVRYPVRVFGVPGYPQITSAAMLVKQYPRIITPEVKQAILDQSRSCLFANDQGAMIGRGQIWFEEQPGGKMKIITINRMAPKPTAARGR